MHLQHVQKVAGGEIWYTWTTESINEINCDSSSVLCSVVMTYVICWLLWKPAMCHKRKKYLMLCIIKILKDEICYDLCHKGKICDHLCHKWLKLAERVEIQIKRNAKIVNYNNLDCCAFFSLSVCTAYLKGQRLLYLTEIIQVWPLPVSLWACLSLCIFCPKHNLVLLSSHKWKFSFKVYLKWHKRPQKLTP